MYPVPDPKSRPPNRGRTVGAPTIDVFTTAELSARRFKRVCRFMFIAAVGFAGWQYRDRLDPSSLSARASSLWTSIVESFHQAFPQLPRPTMKKGGAAPIMTMPKGGSVSPVGRSQRLPVPAAASQAPMPAEPQAPKAIEVEDEPPLGSLSLANDAPPPAAEWPHSVEVEGDVAMKLIREEPEAAQFLYRTAHYEFQADTRLEDMALRELGRVFEATYLVNCKLPLALRPAPEPGQTLFTARLFSNDAAYFGAGAMKGSAGTYSRSQRCILVPLSSLGLKSFHDRVQLDRGGEAQRTLIHEITHQMMNAWLPRLPLWFTEGSAEYVSMADYMHGRFTLNQMDNRLRLYLQRRARGAAKIELVTTETLLAMNSKTWAAALAGNGDEASRNYASAATLVFYFYHLDGDGTGVINYLRAIEHGTASLEAEAKFLLRGRSFTKLHCDLVAALTRLRMPIAIHE